MITSIPFLLFTPWIPILTWIKFSSTFILFGLYYGFLITLPIGPSQLLSIRAFLLEGNLGGMVAITGSILGQFIIFLSVYYSPLYILLLKPHIFSLLLLYYIFFYWYKIKDLLSYQSLRPIISLRDFRAYHLFLNSMFFQLLNPILLPSPFLARLLNIFFFRYSNNILFLTSTLVGWLYGQYLFINISKILLFRIEADSPILYLLVKRIIHRIFSITILSFCLLHLGRIPVPFITKKIIDNVQLNFSKREDSIFSKKSWPSLFFDYKQWKRPLRYIENSRFSTQSPVKKRVSQYFFNPCLSDGKPRLSFTYLPTVAIFEKNFGKYVQFPISSCFIEEWVKTKQREREFLYNEFQDRVKFLYSEFYMPEVRQKKTGLCNLKEKIFTKNYNPLSIQDSQTIVIKKSSWLLNDEYNKSKKIKNSQIFYEKNNKLKDWISKEWKELEYKNFVLPWEPLTRDARRILGLLINKSSKGNFVQNFKQMNFFDGDTKMEFDEKTNFSSVNIRKKSSRKSTLNWEFVLNLSSRQKALFFDYLEIDRWNTLKVYWKSLFFGDINRIKSLSSRINKFFFFRDFNKEIARWTPDSKNDKFDVIAMGVTDIRQRKVKNLGYLIKGRDKRRKIVRRFSQQSDFRRKLVKGSMRARRRKTLIWKMFQLKINSPFFSRILEKPTFFIPYSPKQNGFELESTFKRNLVNKNPYFLKEKISVFDKTKADRLAIANRWDFPLAQWGRGWLLIIQSYIRKYVLLPSSIIIKNICRLFLFQNPEWHEDWIEWNKEIHIRCTYDGTEVSEKGLPEQWLRDGLQIKIIYPFHLKPWYKTKSYNLNLEKNSLFMKEDKFHYCYLSAWGFLTDLPFGNMKKQPSFWKPINRGFLRWRKNIFHNFFTKITQKKSNKVSGLNLDSGKKIEMGVRDTHLLSNKKNNLVLEMPKDSKYENEIYIQKLENLLLKKNKTSIYSNHRQQKNDFFDINIERIKLIKRVIQIKQIISQFYRKNIEFMKKWFSNLEINILKIEISWKIQIEVIKEFFMNLFEN
uniref:Ycf1 n=1 Tax=Nowellia curvifolia TaxID=280839 RepID=UPI00202950BA|nr:Ycf1 [Nowellia curvifolia]UQM88720.1 Ycf1 [Nowellia curvifolia]